MKRWLRHEIICVVPDQHTIDFYMICPVGQFEELVGPRFLYRKELKARYGFLNIWFYTETQAQEAGWWPLRES